MKITNSYQQNFGKYAILNCQVKDAKTRKKNDATLYKYDPTNPRDLREIKQHDFPFNIDPSGYTRIYILEDDKTHESISCAQVSRHLRGKYLHQSGYATLIEDMDASKKYINPSEPLIAGLAKEAQDRMDSSIFLATPTQNIHSISNLRMTANKLGEHYILANRFNQVIDKATERSKIEFSI